jgi:hypothetical protein
MTDQEDRLKALGITPTPPVPPTPRISKSVQEMRDNLEIKKIELEMQRLEQGGTGALDPFNKLLEFQQKSFDNEILRIKEISDLKVEVEKLKLGFGGEDNTLDIIERVLPYIPSIFGKNTQPSTEGLTGESAAAVPIVAAAPQQKEVKMEEQKPIEEQKPKAHRIKNPDQDPLVKAYKKKIKSGEVTEDQAWETLQQYSPKEAENLSREKFHEEFEAIKNGQ